MAHPKRKTSTTRRDKGRTHKKLKIGALSICSTTGETHLRHRAFWYEHKLYYKGRIIEDKTTSQS